MAVSTLLPTIFVSHGGGPCFFMTEDSPFTRDMGPASATANFLRDLLPRHVGTKPKAIVVFSAHYEESVVTVTTGATPPMLYDYYGFPPYTYELEFPAPGDPALAARIQSMLTGAGVPNRGDSKRGFDHGVFIPLMLATPAADVPVVIVSLQSSMDPVLHARIGLALAPLRQEGVLLLGSGAATHNLGRIRSASGPSDTPDRDQAAFVSWLNTTLTRYDGADRLRRLVAWGKEAPGFRAAHPREEHLMPIIPVVAAATPGLVIEPSGRIVIDASVAAAAMAGGGGMCCGGAGAPPCSKVEVKVDGDSVDDASGKASRTRGKGHIIHDTWALGLSLAAYKFE